MRCKLQAAAITLIVILVGASTLWAEQAVRVESDLAETEALFNVTRAGSSGERLDLNLPAISINSVALNGREYKMVGLPGADHLFQAEVADEGKPAVPALTSFLAIPDQAGLSLTVTYGGFDTFENIDLAPAQPSAEESGQGVTPFVEDEAVYGTDAFYPGELAYAADPVIMRDIRMAQISLYPVQYNPVKRQLKVYRDLSVSVSYTSDNVINPKTVHHRYISDGFYPIYQALLSNADEVIPSTASVKRGGYVIITKPMYVDSLKAIVNWKHRKGYNVRVVPTTEILSSGNPTAAQIYTYLQNAYNTWDIPPEYLMIVGDMDVLTTSGVNQYGYNSYTSDHHYAQLEGNDYIPDIFVARMSVDNMAEFRRVAAKIINYESAPFMADTSYWLRGLSVAGNISGATTPRLTVLWVRAMLLDHGYRQVDTSFAWDGYDPGGAAITASLNRGVSIVSYRGWAGSTGWYDPSFDVSALNATTNHNKLGIMASIVCGTGDFGDTYTDPCFGETWIRMGSSPTSMKGGPAFFGCTDHGTHTKWNNPIMVGYYSGILREGVYHFAAAAVWGKLQQYSTFPQNIARGGTVEQYFNTYNMLGDPEVEIRTRIPITISVAHPDSLPFGVNHIEISVTDTMAQPIPDAFVSLVKGYGANEEVFKVEKTDQTGSAILSFDAQSCDTMFLTVSGRDLIPYQGFVIIYPSNISVGFDSLTIDDDQQGHSFGNGDGLVNPGETIELGLSLKNFGTTSPAANVSASLASLDDAMITIFDGHRSYGDIEPGQLTPVPSPYLIHISPNAVNDEIAKVKLSVTDSSGDSWYSVIELPIVSSKLIVSSVSVIDANNRLDPGDSVSLVLNLKNQGFENAQSVTAAITTEDDYARVLSANSSFGDIPIDSTRNNSALPFAIKADPGTFIGRRVNFMLHLTTGSGAKSELPFSVVVGAISSRDPIGPDAYGYYMYDNTDTGYAQYPTYQWVEINTIGTRIPFSSLDDNTKRISLPFDFVYYGNHYNYLVVCTNGWAALDTTKFDINGNYWFNFYNWPIPDPSNVKGQISPFWDDLHYTTSTTNGGFTWFDSTNHRFVIEWSRFLNNNSSSTETFEMIITDPAFVPTLSGDAEIYFQYNTIYNNDTADNYASVGMESYDHLSGLQYTYSNINTPGAAALANGRAIKITTNTGRGGIKGVINLNNGGNNAGVSVACQTGHCRTTSSSGDYWIKNIPPCTTSVKAEIAGYFPQTIDSVVVVANQTINEINFSLDRCPIPANLVASDTITARIALHWDAISHAQLAGYNIYRSSFEGGGFVKLNETPQQDVDYIDITAQDSVPYWYYVTAVYAQGDWSTESFASNTDSGSRLSFIEGIADGVIIPREFFLSQNYPNPFNPATVISYGLPKDSDVKIEVYNVIGQKVVTLLNEHQKAGIRSVVWNGRDSAGKSVSSGIYFYRIDTGSKQDTKKMLLLK